MRSDDLGVNPETGKHSQAFTLKETILMNLLSGYQDAACKITATDLALRFFEEVHRRRAGYEEVRFNIDRWKRDIRELVNHLIMSHDQPILSKAGYDGGYWIAASKEEVDKFYATFRRRAMTGLTKASRGKKALMAEIVKQLAFEFDELKDRPAHEVHIEPLVPEPAPVVVVTSFLDKMTREPEKYAHELRLLRDKFGKVLMPRESFDEIRELSRRLTVALGGIS